jgi:hypothetical protein
MGKMIAAPGEVLIALHAAAITFTELTWDLEWTTRAGKDRTPPGHSRGHGHGRPESSSTVGQVPSDIQTLESRVVYQDSWIRLRQDKIERRDGSQGMYAVAEKADFALAILAKNYGFHPVEEYRYPIARRSWSFPQVGWPGGSTGGNSRLRLAGTEPGDRLRARELTPLGYLHCSHGTADQGFNIFLATSLEPGAPDREAEEQDMQQQWVPRAQFEEMALNGAITGDSSLAAYALLLHEKSAG